MQELYSRQSGPAHVARLKAQPLHIETPTISSSAVPDLEHSSLQTPEGRCQQRTRDKPRKHASQKKTPKPSPRFKSRAHKAPPRLLALVSLTWARVGWEGNSVPSSRYAWKSRAAVTFESFIFRSQAFIAPPFVASPRPQITTSASWKIKNLASARPHGFAVTTLP